jgi:hypothetical protein
MSAETIALNNAATASTDQTIEASALKDAINALFDAYASTKSRVDNELNQVENTSDADKSVSDAVVDLLLGYQLKLVSGDNFSTVNGNSLLSGTPLVIERGQVEIPTLVYASRSSLRTPVIPLPGAGDVVNIPHLGEFQYSTSFDYVDDDEMVFQAVNPSDGTTPIGQWVLSKPAYEFTEAQKMFENAFLWEWMEDEETRIKGY